MCRPPRRCYCLGKADAKPQATARPKPAQEAPSDSDKKPTLVQVIPAEVLLKPNEKQRFRVRLFNSRGRLLGDSPAQFTAKVAGKIDSTSGLFTAASDPRHSAAFVEAQVGDLVGKARIRVVPPLPWKFDFADNAVPVTWVGANYRHVPRTVDGEPVIVKVTTIPKGTRSQAWMGPTDLHDYTIQADVKASPKDGKMPSLGLIAQRYTVDLMGAKQQLQIRSWHSVLTRMEAVMPFAWKTGVWYTLKFQAANEDGKAMLRAKVWERDSSEPSDWTLVATDTNPNRTGSPGLFGNATDGEIFYDNLSVTPN